MSLPSKFYGLVDPISIVSFAVVNIPHIRTWIQVTRLNLTATRTIDLSSPTLIRACLLMNAGTSWMFYG
jgi:hypothetical protein